MPTITLPKLNTLVAFSTLIGMVITGVWFIAPLKTLPEEQRHSGERLQKIEQQIAIQTESLRMLTEVARDSNTLRRDVDRNAAKIELIERQLEAIHTR